MSAPPFMPLYVADYLADTTHLTQAETGAYMLLLMAAWRAGGTLPSDDAKLARFSRSTPAQWQRMRDTILAFFVVENGCIFQRRLSAELAKADSLRDKRKESGRAGGVAKSLKDKGSALANAIAPPCPLDLDIDIEIEREVREERKILSDSSRRPPPPPPPPRSPDPPSLAELRLVGPPAAPGVGSEAFEQLWRSASDAMRKRSSRSRSREEWRKVVRSVSPSLLPRCMERYRRDDPDFQRTGGPGLHIWLREARWEHWAPTAEPPLVITPADHRVHLARLHDVGEWDSRWGARAEAEAEIAALWAA